MLCFFLGILQFSQQFHCKIYIWRWRGPNLIFFLVISITLSFQIKQNLNSKNFVHMGFCGPKCRQNFNILQLAWSLTPNKFWTKYLRCLISIWLQLNHNGSWNLLKNFSKLNFLAILCYYYGFFKKTEIFIFS